MLRPEVEIWLNLFGMLCALSSIVLPLIIFIGVLVFLRQLPQPTRIEPPPSFKNRCPMCGTSPLQSGVITAAIGLRFMASDEENKRFFMPRLRRRTAAARCRRCGFILLFDSKVD